MKQAYIEPFTYPLGIKLINRFLSLSPQRPLDAEEQLEKACQSTGLNDYGSMFFVPAMKEVFKDLNKNTHFHPLGSYLYHKKVQINLTNRLWAQYWLKKDPTINTPLPPTLMITGLQRTGTTFLQRLLGSLPEFRGVVSWEIMNPVPRSKKQNYYGQYQAYLGHKALNYINPEFKLIHSIQYNSLEEEVVLMEHSFMSSIIEAALVAPNYARWLEEQDNTLAYNDLKMWLQFLLWKKPANPYLLLKSPHHMEFMNEFNTVFPHTKIVHMHRDPVNTMASFCSMIYYGKKIFVPECDPIEIGSHWLRKNKRLVANSMAYKKHHPEQFIDIAYRDLVASPTAVTRRIYEDLNIPWTKTHEIQVVNFTQQHYKNKFGKHLYQLEDYGLSTANINNAFEEYLCDYKEYLR